MEPITRSQVNRINRLIKLNRVKSGQWQWIIIALMVSAFCVSEFHELALLALALIVLMVSIIVALCKAN